MTKPKFKEITIQVPAEYKWKTVDPDGKITIHTHKPKPYVHIKYCHSLETDSWESPGDFMDVGYGPEPKDFTKTLERIQHDLHHAE